MIWKTTITFLAALFLSIGIYAQTCPQNNVNVLSVEFRKSDGTPFTPSDDYPIGTEVDGQIFATFGGSTTNAYSLGVKYKIYVNDIVDTEVEECLFEKEEVIKNTPVFISNFTWSWGDKLEIKDIFMRWQTGNSLNKTCPDLGPGGSNSQCYGNDPGFLVRTPLVANFSYNQDCNSEIVSFTDLTTGGYPPASGYEYTWIFKDETGTIILGEIEDEQNPSFDFEASGTYEVTLEAYDGNLTKTETKTVIVFEPGDASISYEDSPYCSIDGTASVTQTGVSGGTYEGSSPNLIIDSTTGKINLSSSLAGTYTVTYYFSDNDCDYSTNTSITIQDPSAPTGEATQDFCAIDTPTVADLSATGTNIKWYAEQGDENALDATTALVDNEDYFATQTVEGCESDEYLQVIVDIADPSAPTGEATQDFCAIDTPTVADLSATGTSIKWYAEQGDENALDATTALVDNEDYFATQTVEGCESDEYLQVIVDIADPSAPTGEATQDFCAIDTPTVADLSATGTNIKWYAEQGDENALDATTALVDNEDYFATQTVEGCESDEYLQVIVDIADPSAPTGEATQDFCAIDTPTVADLSATGTNIKWYAEQGDDNALDATTALVDNEDYFATQTVEGCESDEYLQVIVDIADPSAPTGEATQDFCAIDTPTVADLSATGTNIKWYAEQGDDNALDATTALVDNEDYFATQTVEGCESDEYLQVIVDIADPSAPTGEATQDFCAIDTPTVADLSATGTNIKWYAEQGDENALDATTALVDNEDYFATQTVEGCESDEYLQVIVDIADPSAPTGEATQDFCAIDTPTVADLSATGTNIKWYAEQGDDNALDATTALVDNEDYFATQTVEGCESDEYLQVIVDIADPSAPTGEAVQTFCFDGGATVADLSPSGNNIMWYMNDATDISLDSDIVLTDGEDYYASKIIDGCESVERLMVVVEILPEIELSAEATSVTCNGEADGMITVTKDDSVTFEIFSSENQNVTDNNGSLEAGFYTIVGSLASAQTDVVCTNEIIVEIEVLNNVDPEITVPETLTLEICTSEEITTENARFPLDTDGSEDIKDVFGATGYTASDDQELVSVTYTDNIQDNGGCFPTVIRTFYATDNCGGQASASITLILEDNTDPTFNETLPAETLTVECDSIPEAATLTANDNCSGEIEVTYSETFEGRDDECANEYTIIRNWFAKDCSGNDVSFTQTITVEDTVAPEFNQETLPAAELTVECDNVPAAATLTATDNCSGALNVTYTEEFSGQDDECTNEYIITRTWFASDCAGNELEHVQVIAVEDTVAPEFDQETLPAAELTVECDNIPTAATLTATDNCSGALNVTYTEEFSRQDDECTNEYTITRTWFASDCAGNELEHVQVITVEDTVAPEFDQETLPAAELTVECDNIPTAATLTATDNCSGALNVTYTEEFSGQDDECTNEYTITRTWFASDCAGNELEYVQTITVEDTIAPEFNETIPADMTMECENLPEVPSITATDNCAENVEVKFSEISTKENETDKEYTVTRTWIATDCAGNETSENQIFTIQNTGAPSFNENLPSDVTVECDAVPTAPVLTASDNCVSEVTVDFTEEISGKDDNCPNEYTITRTWTATDDANNEISHIQTINVIDTDAPEFNEELPSEELTVECDAVPAAVTLTASDNCSGSLEVSFDELISDKDSDADNNYTITRSYIATDCAGNEVSFIQIITVEDISAPVITACPEAITVFADMGVCSASEVELGMPTATDNCDTELTYENDAPEVFPLGQTTVTWTITDASNNSVQCEQIVNVTDDEAPVITECASEVNISADAGVCDASEIDLGMPTATDNCDTELTFENDAPEVFPLGQTTVTWTITDASNNSVQCEQLVNVSDDEAPVIETIADINIDSDPAVCGAVVEFESIIATDNCEVDTIEVTEGLESGSEFPIGTTTVTITVTDMSGNTTTTSFDVTVTDAEMPEISCPTSITATTETGESYAIVNFDNATATDNCEVSVEQTGGPVSGSQFPIGTTTVTFTATDASGNSTECSFTVTVEDNEDPSLDCPSDIDEGVDGGVCGAIVEFETPAGFDNSGDVTVTQTSGPASGEQFPVGATTVEFTATDAAGNSATCSFTVTIADDEAPQISDMDDITVNNDSGVCGAVVNFEDATATDNCAVESIVMTEGLISGSEFPVGETIVTYTATDTAGLTATTSFTVTVVDNEAPSIECPESFTVNVEFGTTSTIVTYDALTITDNCGETTTTMTSGIASGEEFPVGETVISYTVTDSNGNEATCQFTVTVEEDPAPAPPAAPSVNVAQATCSEPTGTITVDTQEGLSYSIDGENYQTEGVFTNLTPGTYDVVAQDEFGQLSDLTTVVIEEPVAQEITTVQGESICDDQGEYDLFDLLTGDYDESGTWIDTDNSGALNGNILDPSVPAPGFYTFKYEIEGNCPSITTVTLEIDDCIVLQCSVQDVRDSISKAVTPNGDNKNDFFTVDLDTGCGFTYDVKIFNRWGAKVFDAQNYQNNWDGYSDSSFTSSNQLPSGTYFYVLEIREGNFEPIQGYIYLGTK
ncbi:HYR domain-containing protein [Gramella sp. MAR_2010_147]|uniref:HYR domain-containing protein n=1 Tax=Gramella sp. MAR_2010_147 TaxID=1250205 RepID=UPI00087AF29A|nr:HYR domain-containing protein [Gramella sp. MAR_2010_147]SDR73798.1 gliding motility-associated C-terminal domain-containing protein [Gramella sp. MAR_2010_147]